MPTQISPTRAERSSGNGIKLALAWAFVGIPLIWGVWSTLLNALQLFR
jgi:hypothetical protein